MFSPHRLDADAATRDVRRGGEPGSSATYRIGVPSALQGPPSATAGPWRRDGIGSEGGSAYFHSGFWRARPARPRDTPGLLSHEPTTTIALATDAVPLASSSRAIRATPTYMSHDVRFAAC